MEKEVTVAGRDITFRCAGNETILDAAERAGWGMPYSCRKGVCSSCEAQLVSGEVAAGRGGKPQVGPVEGLRLCQAKPATDVEIDPLYITDRTPPVRRRMTASIFRIDTPTPDVRILHLRFPIGRRIPFQAGQYVKLLLGDDVTRNYSLANPPRDNDAIQLHVRRFPNGYFSDQILGCLEKGDCLDVEMPFGLFSLSDNNTCPILLLATGTGFAPMRSIIADLIRQPVRRDVWFYWGGRTRKDLYAFEQLEHWARRYDWFSFVPVLSRAPYDKKYRSGYVQDAVVADHRDLSSYEVYACGAQTMIDAARRKLTTEAGLTQENFHADVFVPALPEPA